MKIVNSQRIKGIREDLPPGERVLWQGAPSWMSLARHAYHVREVAVYFALLTAVAAADAWQAGNVLTNSLLPATLGAVACALLCALAWMSSRTTIYAITTRRVFLRVGIALPVDVNLPLHHIGAASLATYADGTGDLPLALEGNAHLAYLHLWPHARPWRLRDPEPMLRSIAGAPQVAALLSNALLSAHDGVGTVALPAAAGGEPPAVMHQPELGAA